MAGSCGHGNEPSSYLQGVELTKGALWVSQAVLWSTDFWEAANITYQRPCKESVRPSEPLSYVNDTGNFLLFKVIPERNWTNVSSNSCSLNYTPYTITTNVLCRWRGIFTFRCDSVPGNCSLRLFALVSLLWQISMYNSEAQARKSHCKYPYRPRARGVSQRPFLLPRRYSKTCSALKLLIRSMKMLFDLFIYDHLAFVMVPVLYRVSFPTCSFRNCSVRVILASRFDRRHQPDPNPWKSIWQCSAPLLFSPFPFILVGLVLFTCIHAVLDDKPWMCVAITRSQTASAI